MVLLILSAAQRCSECGSSKGCVPVTEITSEMMDILGQIKQFVSTLDSTNKDLHTPSPNRLASALKLMAKAKFQLINAEDIETVSISAENSVLQPDVVENMGILQTHIDENIRLRKVKEEVTEVMELLSSHLEKIGLKLSLTSTDENEDSPMDSEAGISAIDREEDETGTSLAEEEEDNMSMGNVGDVNEISSVDDAAEVNAEEVTDDAVDEGIEKGDLETTKENQKESPDDVWTDDTDAGTTDDEGLSSLASEASNVSSDRIPVFAGCPANIALKRYLKKSNVTATYNRKDTPEDSLIGGGGALPCYGYACTVLDLTVDAHARTRRHAKLQAAQEMLCLLVRRQEQDTLPQQLTPFTEDELEHLRPLIQSGYENVVNRLRSESKKLGMAPPVYKVVSTTVSPEGVKEVTVQCDGLELSTRATDSNKRKARRSAAKNILLEFDRMNDFIKKRDEKLEKVTNSI